MSDHDVDHVLDAARSLPPPQPTTTQNRRQRRLLDDAIAADAIARRRRLSPAGIAAAVVLVATGAAAAIVGVDAIMRPVAEARAPAPVVQPIASTIVAASPVHVPSVEPTAPTIVATPTPRPAPKKPTTAPKPKPSAAVDVDVDVDAALVMLAEGDANGASAALAQALRSDFVAVDARLARALEGADLDDDAARRVRRLRCETGLRHRRDVAAVDVCRAYTRHHPDDVAARPLAFGAGGLAEDLDRLDDAIDLYTRCIVIAPLHGQSSADALKARARVHARAGHVDDAAADLRLFLRLRPGAGFDDDVRALARELGLR